MPQVLVNGEPRDVPDGTTLDAVVAALGHDPTRPGVAAAVDGHVIRRADWPATAVPAGAEVEVLTAVQGGA